MRETKTGQFVIFVEGEPLRERFATCAAAWDHAEQQLGIKRMECWSTQEEAERFTTVCNLIEAIWEKREATTTTTLTWPTCRFANLNVTVLSLGPLCGQYPSNSRERSNELAG
jgi:hypothetical protein